ncbi:DHH family phosphoesterase [Pectinatus sottacetonis]|uniref:DHH family phosphoesterase n=1 Tax=Pectinatus sottacetonis TaxID=1002795 RepID=UPI0018C70EA2|nr:bifunctional oligoribonuclease/PAP phosphatase NrnA [Pectinatus sottacetonis]
MEITLNEAAEKILTKKNIIIAPHINPDCDGLGSTLALYYALIKKGCNVRIFVDDDIPEAYHFLPGWEKFARPEEKITNADLLIVLDAEPERTGRVTAMVEAPVLNLDHHRSNTRTADYLYLNPQRAATGEIVYQLIKQMAVSFDIDMATCLYTAIATDCGFFKYSNTTSFTMRIAGELLECGVKPNVVSEALERKKLADVKILAPIIDTLEVYNNGTVAAISVVKEIREKCDNTEGFVDFARIVEGVDVAILVKYAEPELTRISMRSKKTDVASIAEKLGGGGHVRAAGCSLKMPFAEAYKKIVDFVINEMAGASDGD